MMLDSSVHSNYHHELSTAFITKSRTIIWPAWAVSKVSWTYGVLVKVGDSNVKLKVFMYNFVTKLDSRKIYPIGSCLGKRRSIGKEKGRSTRSVNMVLQQNYETKKVHHNHDSKMKQI